MGNAQLNDEGQDGEEFVDELKEGTELMHGQYVIESFLNAGGFGITYRAKDSLDRKVVIKECFPGAFCRRSTAIVTARSRAHQKELDSIVRLFVQEARALSKLKHPNIVGVHQVFEENNTAYMALDFVQGRDLLEMIDDPSHTMTEAQIKQILRGVLGAVGFIHDQGILHRDISPDNILVDQNMRPVLIDFGAAREEATKQSRVLSALRVVKDGYSPQEFYIAGSEQTPSSDLYALGASFYHLIAGDTPPNSQARLAAIASGDADPYVSLIERAKGWDQDFLGAIDKSLAVLPKDRIQSAGEWIAIMDGKPSAPATVTPIKGAAASSAVSAAAASAATSAPAGATGGSGKALLLAGVAVLAICAAGGLVYSGAFSGEQPDVAIETEAEPVVENPLAALQAETPAQTEAAAPVGEDAPTELAATADADPVDATADTASGDTTEIAAAPAFTTDARPVARPDGLDQQAGTTAEITQTEATAAATNDAPVTDAGTTQAAINSAVNDAASEAPAPVYPTALQTPQTAPDPVTDVALVGTPVNRSIEDNAPLDLNLQALARSADDADTLPPVELAAIEPGQEIFEPLPAHPLEAVGQELGIYSAWTAILPYDGLFTRETGETRIYSVNGIAIENNADFNDALRKSAELNEDGTVTARIGTGPVGEDVATEQNWTMPVVQETILLSGLGFRTSYDNDAWVTRVTGVPASTQGDLEVDDIVLAYVQTSQRMDARRSIADLLIENVDAGRSEFSFAVLRDQTTWVATTTYENSSLNGEAPNR